MIAQNEEVELQKELHQSENSKVFSAVVVKTGKKLAVKVLNDVFPTSAMIARFNEEAELGKRFEIDGLRKVLGRLKIDDRHALVMEFIEGSTLHQLIAEKQIDIPYFIKLAIRTATVIAEIHKYGLIHKDINPRNFILNKQESKVYLIDLGIATLSKKEYQQLQAPDKLEGTLAYISPEQTGRVNHAIDSRSDLYSLGITFYEMLTGSLPFASTDPMELVHSHIAKTPETPLLKKPNIPPILSKIVMKLIEKDVYQRYQTASGLRADLEYCLETLIEKGEQALKSLDFNLAQKDLLNRFQIPEKLYGRETERKLLLDTFNEVKKGSLACVMVSGYSGIGKTVLIKELYKPVTEQRGYFISGKFEQFQRDIPYSAFIAAIGNWVRQLLGESERRLAHWKTEIIAALENNAGVLTEVVPSLEFIIGKQASPAPLSPVENQNRFNHVLQNFFKNLSTEKHPLVVFIDDWQWADLPSLNLFRLLTTNSSNQYLCWIAAYRDNEVDAAHLFTGVLQDIQKSAIKFIDLKIKGLEKTHLIELLQDTLLVSRAEVESLAELMINKTSGNPFFTSQFLQNLYESGYINYNYESKKWIWNIQQIEALPISNNVLDLMSQRIYTLAPETQKLLALASCIGNYFPLKLLSELAKISQVEVRWTLLQALEEGFLLPHHGSHYSIEDDSDQGVYFRFLHDRVEQAANQRLDKEEFAEKQWQIGQIILSQYPEEYIQENLFDLLSYLNNGRNYAQNEAQKQQLAEFNYQAGKKAKRSTAYSVANHFFEMAISIFPPNLWEKYYSKAFDLYKELGENEFLQGNFENSDRYLALCLEKAQDKLQKADIYKIKIAQFSGQGKYNEAVKMAISAVAMFDINLPNLNDEAHFQEVTGKEIEQYLAYIQKNGIDSLVDLPECQDDTIQAATDILGMALDCAAIGVPSASALLAIKIDNLTFQHGITHSTGLAFIFTATIYGAGFKDFPNAYKIANIALYLAEKRGIGTQFLPKIYHIFGYFAPLSNKSFAESAVYNRKAYEKGLETGDFVYATYGIAVLPRFHFVLSIDMGLESAHYAISFLKKINSIPVILICQSYIGFAYCMKGLNKDTELFDFEDFTEENFLISFSVAAPLFIAIYKRYKLQASYLLGNWAKAGELLAERNTWISVLGGIDIPWRSEYYLYSGLIAMYFYEKTENEEEKAHYEAILDECIAEIDLLQACSDNFTPAYLILQAEKNRMHDNKLLVIENYYKAIEIAEKQEMPQYVGLAAERAALFFLDWDKKDFAKIYFQKAIYAYENWGASAKVKQLKEEYPEFWLLSSYSSSSATVRLNNLTNTKPSMSLGTKHSDSLDFLSVMKASQAISQEIKLEALLRKMVTILMENAGAERALLIQDQDSEWLIAAEASVQKESIDLMQKISLTNGIFQQKIPIKIVRMVYRSQEAIVIHDAQKDNILAGDLYITENKVKSILCMPIIHQGKTRLVIYMEHYHIAGAFTQSRIDILKMLTAQVAISIENSMLYDTLEQKVSERTADLAKANDQLRDKNIRLTDSIHYALTMQEAILPTEKDWRGFFQDSFILYLPKDIVSGDFYWYAQVEQYFVIAVIDCTGHGVPGAFMSMVANTLLNEIVKQKHIVNPAQVLETLHRGIRETLNQGNTNNTDGMDLAFCTIEQKGKRFDLRFTGAKNHLYYSKNKGIGKLEGDRRSIGGNMTRNEKPFTVQELILEEGDSFYLGTDGYIDQAGGKDRQSFTKKRFVDLLNKIADLSMTEQQDRLHQALLEHQNGQAQRDDITVLGFRL